MKKLFLITISLYSLLSPSSIFSQNYVNATCTLNSGRVITGQVKNDFKEDDESIFFKESNDQEVEFKIVDILELLIGNEEKFISKSVEYHPYRLMSYSVMKQSNAFEFKDRKSKHVLLQVLVEGDVNLYKTFIGGISLFYFSKNNDNDLVYLEYYNYITTKNTEGLNNFFTRQLLKNANCNDYLNNKYQSISYSNEDLIDVVDKHNKCTNGFSKILGNSYSKEKVYRLYAFAGFKKISGALIGESLFAKDKKLKGSSTTPNLGLEFSHIIPSRKRNSEIFSRIDFYKIDLVTETELTKIESGVTQISESFQFNSTIIDFSLGFRYYLNSFNENKNGNVGFDFLVNSIIPINSNAEYNLGESIVRKNDFSNDINNYVLGLGFGTSYTYKNKYIFELRYSLNFDYLKGAFVETRFQNVNLNFKYLIFQTKKNK